MAFSLLSHIKQNNKSALTAALAAQSPEQKSELIAFVLAHLVYLNRQDATATYQQMKAGQAEFFWQGIDTDALSAYVMQAYAGSSFAEVQAFIAKIMGYLLQDINDIDDTASLAQDGVSELIEGQLEHLAGEAADPLWAIAQLPELQGQVEQQDAPVDLQTSIASLSKMIHDAATQNQPASHHDQHDPHHDSHGHPASIELPPQREAPTFFRVLEPLVAVLILLSLLCWFSGYNV